MTNYVPILTSCALNTMHISKTENVGVHGVALGVRKINTAADDKIVQPAFTISGYPEYGSGSGSVAVARETTKYIYDAIVTSELG